MFECEKENNAIAAAIKYGMRLYNVTPKQMAKAMQKDSNTFYRRMRKPEEFKISELRVISAKIHTSVEKIIKGETQ